MSVHTDTSTKTDAARVADRRSGRAVPAVMLAAVVAWGAGFSGGELLLDQLGPGGLAAARTLLTAVTLAVAAAVMRPAGPPPARGDGWRIALAGIVGIAGYNLALFYGIRYVDAGTASVVVATSPILVALLAWLFLAEPLDRGRGAALLLAFSGVAVLTLASGDGFAVGRVVGLIVLVGAPLSWAIYTVVVKPLAARWDAVRLGHRSSWAAVAVSAPLLVMEAEAFVRLDLAGWLWLVYLGTVGGGLTILVYAWALRRWSAAGLASFAYLVPVAGILWAWILVGHTPGLATVLGGGLVVCGVTTVWRSRPVTQSLGQVLRAALAPVRSVTTSEARGRAAVQASAWMK